MNRNNNSEDAIFELETTNAIEILNDEENELYMKCLRKSGYKKDKLIKLLKEEGFSEFIIGAIIGVLLITEDQIKPKQGKESVIAKLKTKIGLK